MPLTSSVAPCFFASDRSVTQARDERVREVGQDVADAELRRRRSSRRVGTGSRSAAHCSGDDAPDDPECGERPAVRATGKGHLLLPPCSVIPILREWRDPCQAERPVTVERGWATTSGSVSTSARRTFTDVGAGPPNARHFLSRAHAPHARADRVRTPRPADRVGGRWALVGARIDSDREAVGSSGGEPGVGRCVSPVWKRLYGDMARLLWMRSVQGWTRPMSVTYSAVRVSFHTPTLSPGSAGTTRPRSHLPCMPTTAV